MTDTPPPAGPNLAPTRRPRRRWVLVTGTVVVLAATAVVLDLAHPFGTSPTHPFNHPAADTTATGDASADPVATQAVAQRTLSAQTTVDATLGYAEDYTVTNQYAGNASTGNTADPAGTPSGGQSASSGSAASTGSGVVTGLPKPGQIITQGQALYQVNGVPVVLLYGSTPAYRTLAEGKYADEVTGVDVAQLNHDLVDLGYLNKSTVDTAWDQFGWATKAAVEKLQHHFGLDQTGVLDLGTVAFLPTEVRVTTVSAALGAAVGRGSTVFTGTSTARQVAIDLDTSDQSEVKAGDQVSITLPNNQTTPGVVSTVGTVATSSSTGAAGGQSGGSSGSSSGSGGGASSSDSTIEVDVTLSDPKAAGTWDQAPVTVTITTDTVPNALVVPVVALLAQSGGGYAVEVADLDSPRRLEPVTLGLFDDADGLVQVTGSGTGSGLAAGQNVVVPKL